MPQDGSNNYYYPPGTPGVPDTTIESDKYNTFLDDLVVNDLNIARPVHRGGTGATTAAAALTNLGAEKATQVVTNFDSHVWAAGSFMATSVATNSPFSGHAFSGICYLYDANHIIVEARDLNESGTPPMPPGTLYARYKAAGVWGPWVAQIGGVADADARYVNLTGDTMSGPLIMNAGIISSMPYPAIYLNKNASGGQASLFGCTGGIGNQRWRLDMGDSAAETGTPANTGSNFALHAFNDAGAFLGTVASANRFDMRLNILEPLTTSNAATKYYVDSKVTAPVNISIDSASSVYNANLTVKGQQAGKANLEFGHLNNAGFASCLSCENTTGAPYLALNAGPGTSANTYKTLGVKGAVIRSDLAGGVQFGTIANANADNQVFDQKASISTAGAFACNTISTLGDVSVGGSQTVVGNINVSGGISATSNITCAAIFANSSSNGFWANGYAGTGNPWTSLMVRGDAAGAICYLQAQHFSGLYYNTVLVTGASAFDFRSDSQAYKAGGGDWGTLSDARIKNVLGDYGSGLDAIAALRPVRYTYKGNDTAGEPSTQSVGKAVEGPDAPTSKDAPTIPYVNSIHYAPAVVAQEYIGLIAQEAEIPMPEMVNPVPGYIDGIKVEDVRHLDTTPLIFALVNAVKELKARVEQLENPA